jgi:hypothetical protein
MRSLSPLLGVVIGHTHFTSGPRHERRIAGREKINHEARAGVHSDDTPQTREDAQKRRRIRLPRRTEAALMVERVVERPVGSRAAPSLVALYPDPESLSIRASADDLRDGGGAGIAGRCLPLRAATL